LGYYFTLQVDGTLEELFPSFSHHVIDSKTGKNDSQISLAFARCLKLIQEISKQYCDEETLVVINESIDEFKIKHLMEHDNLKAHGCKKLGIQTLGNLLTLSIQDISMRGGWALKSFNTFFDYWVGSLPASVRTGKMIAGWRQVLGQGYHGGAPPTLEDIFDENDKVDNFVLSWLGHNIKIHMELKKLLVANMLRHWKETVDIIKKEPTGRYQDEKWRFHPFVNQVIQACHYNNITEATFNGWVEVVRNGFIQRNIMSMARSECEEVGYDNINIDGRSFLEVTEANSKM